MSEVITVDLVETVDHFEVTLTEVAQELTATIIEVQQGPAGPPGPPAGGSALTVSVTAPSNPAINDLWLQLPP